MTFPGSTLPVPASLTKGTWLQVIDYDVLELTGKADATGSVIMSGATTAGGVLPQGQWLRVERIVMISGSANTVSLGVYESDGSDPIPQRTRDGTPIPAGLIAVAEYPSYLTIRPTQCLTLLITEANPGDVFLASVQYQLVQKATS